MNISIISAENLLAFTILLLKVTIPNKPIDNDNINNYNGMN
jgi:hypothetical protein